MSVEGSSLDDWRKKQKLHLQGIERAVKPVFEGTKEYKKELGEIMLNLELVERPRLCSLVLEHRRPAVSSYDGKDTNVTDYADIEIPERQEIGLISTLYLENALNYPSLTRFRDRFLADTDDLIEAIDALFLIIRDYENNTIDTGNNIIGQGKGRKAIVSVTNMGILRGFDAPGLQKLPDTYNTHFSNPGRIYLPPMSNGQMIQIAKIAYFN